MSAPLPFLLIAASIVAVSGVAFATSGLMRRFAFAATSIDSDQSGQ